MMDSRTQTANAPFPGFAETASPSMRHPSGTAKHSSEVRVVTSRGCVTATVRPTPSPVVPQKLKAILPGTPEGLRTRAVTLLGFRNHEMCQSGGSGGRSEPLEPAHQPMRDRLPHLTSPGTGQRAFDHG